MNDEFNYLKLIEIPVCSTEVVVQPTAPKKRRRKAEELKAAVIEKVNGDAERSPENEGYAAANVGRNIGGAEHSGKRSNAPKLSWREARAIRAERLNSQRQDGERLKLSATESNAALPYSSASAVGAAKTAFAETKGERGGLVKSKGKRRAERRAERAANASSQGERKREFSGVIMAQIAVICILVVTIFLTNIFWEESGINTLVKSVFATDKQTEIPADTRVYSAFSPNSPVKSGSVEIVESVMSYSGGAVYPIADGKITDIVETDGKYNIIIEHSSAFKSVVSGADYAYFNKGDAVFGTVPVAFGKSEIKIYLYDNNVILTNYAVDNGKIVWQS